MPRLQQVIVAANKASGVFAPGGVAGNFASGRVYPLGLKYVNGPLSAALAYETINNPSVSVLDSALSPGQTGYVTPGGERMADLRRGGFVQDRSGQHWARVYERPLPGHPAYHFHAEHGQRCFQ